VPSLAAELLAGAPGMTVPAHGEARIDSGDLADVKPTEYRTDAVVVLSDGGGPDQGRGCAVRGCC